jgi:hypothetical protein
VSRLTINRQQINQVHPREFIVRAHQITKTTQRAISARCVVVRSFAMGLPLAMSQRSSAILSPWSTGNGYEDAPQPGEVGV